MGLDVRMTWSSPDEPHSAQVVGVGLLRFGSEPPASLSCRGCTVLAFVIRAGFLEGLGSVPALGVRWELVQGRCSSFLKRLDSSPVESLGPGASFVGRILTTTPKIFFNKNKASLCFSRNVSILPKWLHLLT